MRGMRCWALGPCHHPGRHSGCPGQIAGDILCAMNQEAINTDRFAPLHDWAFDTLDRLAQEYQVVWVEGAQDPGLGYHSLSRPTVRLVPEGEGAPITVAFTNFPSLAVRLGKWATVNFPSCGCDDCAEDEQPEDLFDEFTELVNAVVAGTFWESAEVRDSEVWTHHVFSYQGGTTSGGSRLSLEQAPEVTGRTRQGWRPWLPRPQDCA